MKIKNKLILTLSLILMILLAAEVILGEFYFEKYFRYSRMAEPSFLCVQPPCTTTRRRARFISALPAAASRTSHTACSAMVNARSPPAIWPA